MPMSETAPTRAPRGSKIRPANLRDLPTVLDAKEAASVLHVDVCTVRKLTKDGRLHRLPYSPRFLFDAREILRFLKKQSAAQQL